MPILCMTVMPFSAPVKRRVIGIRTLSYNGMRRIMEMVMALWRVAGGILKSGPMFRSIVMPCLVKKVAGCWKITANIRSIVQIGNSRRTSFTLSGTHTLSLGIMLLSLAMDFIAPELSWQSGLLSCSLQITLTFHPSAKNLASRACFLIVSLKNFE